MPWRAVFKGRARRFRESVRTRKVDRRLLALGSLVGVAALGWFVSYIGPGLLDWVLQRGDDPPLAVTTEIAPPVGAAGDDSNVFFVPLSADELPPPPRDCGEMRDWALGLGGSDVGTTTVRVYLQSRADHNVIVDGSVDVVQVDEEAQAGTLVSCEPGGDFSVPRRVEIDLDDGDQPWRFFVSSREQPEALELSIDAGEAEVVDLQDDLDRELRVDRPPGTARGRRSAGDRGGRGR